MIKKIILNTGNGILSDNHIGILSTMDIINFKTVASKNSDGLFGEEVC